MLGRITGKITGANFRRAVFIAALLCFYSAFTFFLTGSVCFTGAMFGVPCPGCGMTRAYLAVFNLDFAAAFHMHPLFLYPPILIIAIAVKTIKSKNRETRWFTRFCVVSLILFAFVYAVRMLMYFPHTAPMVLNVNSFLFRLIRFVQSFL
jgi:hypothetical protein